MDRTAVVIGAGIGGLTAARALHRNGWEVVVCEQASSIEPVGAGLAMAPNALRGLDDLGVGEHVRAHAGMRWGAIRRSDGRYLVRLPDLGERHFGDTTVVLRRSTLAQLLIDGLPADTVRTSARVTRVDTGGPDTPARVHTGDGTIEAGLVVAADGIRSATRSALFPDHAGLRYSGFTAWRFIVGPLDTPPPASETWGRGVIVGNMPLADGAAYLYATANAPAGERAGNELAELSRHIGDWHDPIPALLAAAAPDTVLRNDVWDLAAPLPAHHRGRVVLIGDAAHPMTPNLGQGACQAIEDAVTLGHVVRNAEAADVPRMLARYTEARLERTTGIVRRSARVGALLSSKSRTLTAARDLALAVTSRVAPGAFERGLTDVFDWSPHRLHEHT